MQLAPAASDAPQALVPVVMAKSSGLAPVMVGTMLVSEPVPVLDSVAESAVAVVFSTVLGKTTNDVREAVGEPADESNWNDSAQEPDMPMRAKQLPAADTWP